MARKSHTSTKAEIDRILSKHAPQDMFTAVDILSKEGIELEPELLPAVSEKLTSDTTPYLFPQHMADFIAELAASFKPQTMLDPFAGVGVLALTVARRLHPAHCTVISGTNDEYRALQTITRNKPFSVYHAMAKPLDKLSDTFDLIVGQPDCDLFEDTPRPDNWMPWHWDHKRKLTTEQFGVSFLCMACQHLAENGIALVLTPQRDVLQHKSSHAKLRRELPQGTSVYACIEVPSWKYWMPARIQSAALLAIRRKGTRRCFMAEYSADRIQQQAIVENFRARRDGRYVTQGVVEKKRPYVGMVAQQARARARDGAFRCGYSERAFAEVVERVDRLANAPPAGGPAEETRCVYLPLRGHAEARVSTDERGLEDRQCARLVIKEDVADPRFVAGMLNLPVGMAIREAAITGRVFPQISIRRLSNWSLFLPPLEVQRDVVRGEQDIGELHRMLSELRLGLWGSTERLRATRKVLERMKTDEAFDEWFEVLPAPLARLLCGYWADRGLLSSSGSADILQSAFASMTAFFEAVAAFTAIVHLSAWFGSGQPQVIGRGLGEAIGTRDGLERPSFGTWKNCVDFLGRQTKELLKQDGHACCHMYALPDETALGRLAAPKTAEILADAVALRNRHAHPARPRGVGASEVRELEGLVAKYKEATGDLWERYHLVRLGACDVGAQEYRYTGERAVGTRAARSKYELVLTEALESKSLCLWCPGQRRALPLLPLIRALPPDGDIYIFNKRVGNKLEFVCAYRREGDDLERGEFPDAMKLLKDVILAMDGSEAK